MSFLNKLFGGDKDKRPSQHPESPALAPQATRPPATTQSGFDLQLEELVLNGVEYFVERAKSPNGQHTVAWACPQDTESGLVASIEESRVVWHTAARKPEVACVSDNGVVVYCDLGSVAALSCVFTALAPDGTPLVEKRLGALPSCAAVSPDGRFAACQLLGSNSETDSTKLVFFDLTTKSVLWKRTPAAGPADSCSIDQTAQVINLGYRNGISHRFDFGGRFLSADDWKSDRIMHLYGDQLLEEVEPNLPRPTPTTPLPELGS